MTASVGQRGSSRTAIAKSPSKRTRPPAGYVVLNDPYHPWWSAAVDGAEAPVLRANVLFRAVAVPPGRHTVRFEFRPLAGAWRELMTRRP